MEPTFIVLTGLLFLNATRDATTHEITQLDVYFLDSQDKHTPWGTRLDTHHPEIFYDPNEDPIRLEGDLKMAGGPGNLSLHDQKRFLDVPRFFAESVYNTDALKEMTGAPSKPLVLRGECTGGTWADATAKCTSEGKPLLAARLSITGAWDIQPYEANTLYQPSPERNSSLIGMALPRKDSPTPEFLPPGKNGYFQLASAVLLRPKGAGAAAISRVSNRTAIEVQSITKGFCKAWFAYDGTCRALVFSNHPHAAEAPENAPAMPSPLVGEIEEHFALIYELFQDKPVHRLTPTIRQLDPDFFAKITNQEPGSRGPTWICPGGTGKGLWQ